MSFVWKSPEGPLKIPEQVVREIHAVSLARGLDELATVLATMCVTQESDFWCPFNSCDPESKLFSYDSEGDDNRSVGYFQQQKGPNGELWWGDTRSMMTLSSAANQFLDRLDDDYTTAANAQQANDFIQAVQRSGVPNAYAQHWDSAWELVRRALAHPGPLPDPVPSPTPTPAPLPVKPDYTELDRYGDGWGVRSRAAINWFLHTEEGNSNAEQLAQFCDGSNNVSYHYTLRDGVLCNVVDTDKYSWSVLDANVFSINLCYAGSRAGWSRDEWLCREHDIEISAYIAVEDCRKYGIPITVITPPYTESAGISDHRYVTEQLGIGSHTDVGGPENPPWTGYPWDVFEKYVDKYAGIAEENPPMAGSARASQCIYRQDNNDIGDTDQVIRNIDGTVQNFAVEDAARLGDTAALGWITAVASGNPPVDDLPDWAQSHAKLVLDSMGVKPVIREPEEPVSK